MLVETWDPVIAQHMFRAVDLAGVLCNGIIGGKLARDRQFDAVGFGVLAFLSALGGGVCRDLMLNQIPVAITDPFYLGTALFGAAIAFLWRMDSRFSRRVLLAADSLCLGCWAATGATKALNLGFGIGPALLMGMITAVGGGMIRDMASGSVPRVFGGNNLYATPALISALVMVAMWELDMPVAGMGASIICSAIFVVVSQRRGWQLPQAPEMTVTLTARQLLQLMKLRGIRVKRGENPVGDIEGTLEIKSTDSSVVLSQRWQTRLPINFFKPRTNHLERSESAQEINDPNVCNPEELIDGFNFGDSEETTRSEDE